MESLRVTHGNGDSNGVYVLECRTAGVAEEIDGILRGGRVETAAPTQGLLQGGLITRNAAGVERANINCSEPERVPRHPHRQRLQTARHGTTNIESRLRKWSAELKI